MRILRRRYYVFFALESRVLFITHPLQTCATVTKRAMIAFRDVGVEVRYERTLRALIAFRDVDVEVRCERNLRALGIAVYA
jgi:hypothetical protein